MYFLYSYTKGLGFGLGFGLGLGLAIQFFGSEVVVEEHTPMDSG